MIFNVCPKKSANTSKRNGIAGFPALQLAMFNKKKMAKK